MHDRDTGITTLVSKTSDGTQANCLSRGTSISADGRFVAFESDATNLINGDTNDTADAFIHDRDTGQTTGIVSPINGSPAEGVLCSISANGRYVAFQSPNSNLFQGDTNGQSDTFVYDRDTDDITLVSVTYDRQGSNGFANYPAISGDGLWVAFQSDATNLVPDDTNNVLDAFIAPVDFDAPPLATEEPTEQPTEEPTGEPEPTDEPGIPPQPNYFTTSTPTLTWNRLSWATDYEIQIADTPNFDNPLPLQTTNQLSIVPDLSIGSIQVGYPGDFHVLKKKWNM